MPRNLNTDNGNRQRQRKWLMRIETWNVQVISTKWIEVFTETKRNGNGIEEEKSYIQIYSGVSKDQRARCGVSLLIKKKYKKCIKEWQCVYTDERLVQVQMRLNGYNVNIVGVYAPNDDADDKQKEEFYNKLRLITDYISSRQEIVIIGDLNARIG